MNTKTEFEIEDLGVESFNAPDSTKTVVTVGNQEILKEILIKLQLGNAEINNCQISNKYSRLESLEKSSASDALIYLATRLFQTNDQKSFIFPVAIKSFINAIDVEENNSLIVEAIIYKYYVTRMLTRLESPHFIAFVAWTQCDLKDAARDMIIHSNNRTQTLGRVDKLIKDFYSELTMSQKKSVENQSLTLSNLVIEKARNSITFHEYLLKLQTLRYTPQLNEQLKSFVFQLVYTLECICRYGIRHNDLHFGNIFVNNFAEWDGKSFNRYRIEGKTFDIPAQNMVQIYDWDRGTVKNNLKNNMLSEHDDYCKQFGQCNRDNDKFDIVKVLCELSSQKYKKLRSWPFVTELLNYSISPRILELINSQNSFCMLSRKGYGDFYPASNGLQTPYWAKDTLSILKDSSVFSKFEVFGKQDIESDGFPKLESKREGSNLILASFKLPSRDECNKYSMSISEELKQFYKKPQLAKQDMELNQKQQQQQQQQQQKFESKVVPEPEKRMQPQFLPEQQKTANLVQSRLQPRLLPQFLKSKFQPRPLKTRIFEFRTRPEQTQPIPKIIPQVIPQEKSQSPKVEIQSKINNTPELSPQIKLKTPPSKVLLDHFFQLVGP